MFGWSLANAFTRFFFIPSVVMTIAGCKLGINPPEGGRVISESAAYQCDSGQKCTIDVVDTFFDETFVAQPAVGHYFRRWKSGERLLCGDTYGKCRLSTKGFAGNAALEKVLESEEHFFLTPLFAEGACESSRIETSDVFGNIFVEQGQKCSASGSAEAVRQGMVTSTRNGALVSVIGWDQGRMHGLAKRYHSDGKTLQEKSHYAVGKYNGQQRQYDKHGRLILSARWQSGQLQGRQVVYDYTDAAYWNGEPVVSVSHYENGKLDGTSTVDYPSGVWESREWVAGVQQGPYQVFAPETPRSIYGWRYVYLFLDGLPRHGYAYARFAGAGPDGYIEEGGPDGPWHWDCVYTDGVLDEASCFKDGLDLGPRF